VVGVIGLLQPLADGLKLFLKEIISNKSNKILFLIAPVLFLALIIRMVNYAFKVNSVMLI
jgi:NADH:ubiquinone oxidoreductase subunit H